MPFRAEPDEQLDRHPRSWYFAWTMLTLYGLAFIVGAVIVERQNNDFKHRLERQTEQRATDLQKQAHARCVAFRESVATNRDTLKAVIAQTFMDGQPADVAALTQRFINVGVAPDNAEDIARVVATLNADNPTRDQQLQTLLDLVDADPLPDCQKLS